MSNENNFNIDNAEAIIHNIGEVTVTHANYIKASLDVMDNLYLKLSHEKDQGLTEFWLRQIDDVLEITKRLLKAPIEDDKESSSKQINNDLVIRVDGSLNALRKPIKND